MDLKPLETYILGVCAHDDVGLWRVMKHISPEQRAIHPLPMEVRMPAVLAIGALLEAGLIVAGSPNGSAFTAMTGTPTAVVAGIEQGLDDLVEPIGPGDVCWLRATPAGEKLAKELDLKGY